MYTGKTKVWINRFKKVRGHKLVFKPSIDDRYDGVNYATTYDGIKIPATPLPDIADLIHFVEDGKKYSVFIDEVQFFDKVKTTKIINWLLAEGNNIYVNGLDYYSMEDGKPLVPFGATIDLLDQADEALVLTAECHICKSPDAIYSYKIGGNLKEKIEIGGEGTYIAVCEKCELKKAHI